MRFLGKLFALGAFALITISMSLTPATAKDLKIGVVNLSLCCAYFVGMDEAIKDEAKVFPNITVLSTDSAGDKRIKVIADRFPDVYEIMTTSKVVQGAGRSVRSKDDYAVTYLLDTSIKRLWASKLNEWSDEFSTVHTNSLNPSE